MRNSNRWHNSLKLNSESDLPENGSGSSFAANSRARRPGDGAQTWKKPLFLILGVLALAGLAGGRNLLEPAGLITVQSGKVQRQDLTSIVTA